MWRPRWLYSDSPPGAVRWATRTLREDGDQVNRAADHACTEFGPDLADIRELLAAIRESLAAIAEFRSDLGLRASGGDAANGSIGPFVRWIVTDLRSYWRDYVGMRGADGCLAGGPGDAWSARGVGDAHQDR